jgi:DEAD/DEAH box helicase domain-containing protein
VLPVGIDTRGFVHHLTSLPAYRDQIVHVEHLRSQEAGYGELVKPLPPALDAALRSAGLFPLYSHQAEAINFIRSGKNVIIVTPAASGKTLCYNLPVLEALLTDRRGCALYLYPTKALAQDQLRSLQRLSSLLPQKIRYGTFDGDTPQEKRMEIKRSAQIVLTNPDMLHLGILPHHLSWHRLFRGLKYVVIDEAHIYRGVFGSHLGNVLRRLRRLCAVYGAAPQFICCSATIANPREHAEKLVGLPFEVIDNDGSPRGERDFILWNPPLVDEAKNLRRSANTEAAFLLTELMRSGIRTLTFARTRKVAELIYAYTKEQLTDSALAEQVKPYRAGYLPEERRRIEQELFSGQLLGAVSTSALELGIDIGDMEATVLTGYPGSIASTWQQAGRSGRKGGHSLSFLIGLDNPLDQYFMRHPQSLFQQGFEHALIDPHNPYILKPHLLCAAWETPLTAADEEFFAPDFASVVEELEAEGRLRKKEGRWYIAPFISYPAERINLRSASSHYYLIVDISQNGRQLETVEASVALSQVHPGAIYLHQGEAYLVVELDLMSRIAYVTPAAVPYYTQAKEITELRILQTRREKRVGSAGVYLGEVEVTTTVVGFKKKMQFTEEVIGEEVLDLPPYSFDTVALWFDIPAEAMAQISRCQLDFAGGLHAAEHTAIALLPLFALCDRNDIGGVSTPLHPDTGRAQIFIYDAYPGGVGISEKGFELVQNLWQATLQVIAECPCEEGCPGCIHSPKCGNNNEPLDKAAARKILEALLEAIPSESP